jgi:hypothetical protein
VGGVGVVPPAFDVVVVVVVVAGCFAAVLTTVPAGEIVNHT